MRALVAILAGVALVAAPAAASSSLPAVGSGHRPGPDILYAPPAGAPQLENTGIWKAHPILVSGASAYRRGEFLYQDYLYDDHGASGVIDQDDATFIGNYLFSPSEGSYTYPEDPVYAGNNADLVELRVKPLADATAFRVTLNTLLDPERVGFTIALGSSDAPVAWPDGAGVQSPAQRFLTVHGRKAELTDAASGKALAPAPSVAVDLGRRQFTVTVPHAAWDPGTSKVRMAAGVGVWDTAAGTYMTPGPAASATAPGGVAPSRAAIVNVAFRPDEPTPDLNTLGLFYTLADAAVGAKIDGSWWREKAQADALRSGDISAFSADVDFAALKHHVEDDSQIPRSGWVDRIFGSHFAFGQGVNPANKCPRFPTTCHGILTGNLQTYALYVPDRAQPSQGWGMTVALHALSGGHNMYNGSKLGTQLGDRGPGSVVLTPGSRGPDGDYTEYTEADVFEAWADVARHYRLDPDWTAITGYSMGGGGTYKLIQRWPDLFARGAGLAAGPKADGEQVQWMEPMRNVPILTWTGAADEGTDITVAEQTIPKLEANGLRFVWDIFPGSDHLTPFTNDEFGPVADFLGTHRVDRDPPHVSYVLNGAQNFPAAGVVADHAYWVSGLRARDAANPVGKVDAFSKGFGTGDPPVLAPQMSTGVLEGGRHGPTPYERTEEDWGPAPVAPAADALVLKATNLAWVTVDVRRARLSCHPDLQVTTDGPLDVTLAGCGRTVSFGS